MECKALFFLLKTVCLQEGEYDMFINGSSPGLVEVRESTSIGIKHTHMRVCTCTFLCTCAHSCLCRQSIKYSHYNITNLFECKTRFSVTFGT